MIGISFGAISAHHLRLDRHIRSYLRPRFSKAFFLRGVRTKGLRSPVHVAKEHKRSQCRFMGAKTGGHHFNLKLTGGLNKRPLTARCSKLMGGGARGPPRSIFSRLPLSRLVRME